MALVKHVDTTALIAGLLSSAMGPKGAALAPLLVKGAKAAPNVLKKMKNYRKLVQQSVRHVAGRSRGKRASSGRSTTGSTMLRSPPQTAPVAQTMATGVKTPKVGMRDGSTVVSHSEFVTDVHISSLFSGVAYDINPGLTVASTGLFTWLVSLANSYQRYEFTKLVFRYVCKSSTSKSGSFMMAFLSDPVEGLPAGKLQMMNIANAVSVVPWQSCEYAVPANMLRAIGPTRMLRNDSSTIADPAELSTYDVGRLLTYAVEGDGTVTGELYVDYEVVFSDPYVGATPGPCVFGRAEWPGRPAETGGKQYLFVRDLETATGAYDVPYAVESSGETLGSNSDYYTYYSMPKGTYYMSVILVANNTGLSVPYQYLHIRDDIGLFDSHIAFSNSDSLVDSAGNSVETFYATFDWPGGLLEAFLDTTGSGTTEVSSVSTTLFPISAAGVGAYPMTSLLLETHRGRLAPAARQIASFHASRVSKTTPVPCARAQIALKCRP